MPFAPAMAIPPFRYFLFVGFLVPCWQVVFLTSPRHPGEYLLRWTVFDRYILGDPNTFSEDRLPLKVPSELSSNKPTCTKKTGMILWHGPKQCTTVFCFSVENSVNKNTTSNMCNYQVWYQFQNRQCLMSSNGSPSDQFPFEASGNIQIWLVSIDHEKQNGSIQPGWASEII